MTVPRRAAFAALALVLAAGAAHAGGLDIHAHADAAEVGLPAYPGAIPRSDPNGDPTGFSFGLWGESFGIKLAVASYRSVDGIDKVSAFYRDALAKYGPVLDCSHGQAPPDAPKSRHDDKSGKDKPVSCDLDSGEAGARLYKVGTENSQRVFKATPWHDGTRFELVRIEQHGTD